MPKGGQKSCPGWGKIARGCELGEETFSWPGFMKLGSELEISTTFLEQTCEYSYFLSIFLSVLPFALQWLRLWMIRTNIRNRQIDPFQFYFGKNTFRYQQPIPIINKINKVTLRSAISSWIQPIRGTIDKLVSGL